MGVRPMSDEEKRAALQDRLGAMRAVEARLLSAAAPCNQLSLDMWLMVRRVRERFQRNCLDLMRK